MKKVFVDTSFLVAFHHTGDPFHEKAQQLISEREEDCRFVITDYIFDEFVTVLQKALSKKSASETGYSLLEDKDFELHWVTKRYFKEALDVFSQFEDKSWSFTDCTSYAWIRKNRPDFCLATDSDFDEFGLVPNLVRV